MSYEIHICFTNPNKRFHPREIEIEGIRLITEAVDEEKIDKESVGIEYNNDHKTDFYCQVSSEVDRNQLKQDLQTIIGEQENYIRKIEIVYKHYL